MSLYLGNTPIANTGYNKANTDLSNLTSTGKNIANWSNNVTNCITEIPQDIKLEFANGTLTLKAGSKLYDGLGNSYTVPNDMSFSSASGSNTQQFMLIKSDLSGAIFVGLSDTNASYNSTTGLVEYTGLGTYLLPVAITSHSSTTYTGIDQVFNGFGYIDSTVFALPGVKGLIPNGRNEDGSLKNIEVVVNSVMIYTITGWERLDLLLFDNSINVWPSQYSRYTDENFYEVYDVSQSKWVKSQAAVFGFASFNSKITSFTTKNTFHALDYNDFNNIPHIVETYQNGDSWYRIYSDGWCEQRIWCSVNGARDNWSYNIGDFQLLKEMKDTTYTVMLWSDQQHTNNGHAVTMGTKTTTNFKLNTYNCAVYGPALIFGYAKEE